MLAQFPAALATLAECHNPHRRPERSGRVGGGMGNPGAKGTSTETRELGSVSGTVHFVLMGESHKGAYDAFPIAPALL